MVSAQIAHRLSKVLIVTVALHLLCMTAIQRLLYWLFKNMLNYMNYLYMSVCVFYICNSVITRV